MLTSESSPLLCELVKARAVSDKEKGWSVPGTIHYKPGIVECIHPHPIAIRFLIIRLSTYAAVTHLDPCFWCQAGKLSCHCVKEQDSTCQNSDAANDKIANRTRLSGSHCLFTITVSREGTCGIIHSSSHWRPSAKCMVGLTLAIKSCHVSLAMR